jgi:hypothetical protein
MKNEKLEKQESLTLSSSVEGPPGDEELHAQSVAKAVL